MPNQLLTSLGMLAFGETGELFCSNRTSESKLLGQCAVPFALNRVTLLPIILLARGELFRVVCPRLTGGQRFRDGQHGNSLTPENEVLRFKRLGFDDNILLHLGGSRSVSKLGRGGKVLRPF